LGWLTATLNAPFKSTRYLPPHDLRARALVGILLVVVGVIVLFLLRHLLLSIVLVVLGVIGVIIGIVCILVGLGLIFWRGRGWYSVETATRT